MVADLSDAELENLASKLVVKLWANDHFRKLDAVAARQAISQKEENIKYFDQEIAEELGV